MNIWMFAVTLAKENRQEVKNIEKALMLWNDIQNELHFSYLFDTSGRLNLLRRLLDCVGQDIVTLPDCEEEDNNDQEDEDDTA
jgi:hypothetical protein